MLAWECTFEDELAIREEEGQEKERARMAIDMLADGKDISEIMKYSKLPREEIFRLKELALA